MPEVPVLPQRIAGLVDVDDLAGDVEVLHLGAGIAADRARLLALAETVTG
jgi:hypothetical protein